MQPLILLTAQVQNPSVISVNFWQIVVSLLNLVIIYIVIKKFLFKPIGKAMQNRQSAIEEKNAQAEAALNEANEAKAQYQGALSGAKEEANRIIEDATASANKRKEKITAEARAEAEEIIRGAKTSAELEKKKAQGEIKEQIVDVSTELATKIIGREINADDHHKLIDEVISGIDEE